MKTENFSEVYDFFGLVGDERLQAEAIVLDSGYREVIAYKIGVSKSVDPNDLWPFVKVAMVAAGLK